MDKPTELTGVRLVRQLTKLIEWERKMLEQEIADREAEQYRKLGTQARLMHALHNEKWETAAPRFIKTVL